MGAPHVVILGLGYTGTGLANRIAANHPEWTVTGTVRRPGQPGREGQSRNNASYPLHPRVDTVEYSCLADHMATHGVTHVLCTIPPEKERELRASHTLAGLLRSRDDPVWTGYISTTSVYGDHGGGLVDEESALISNENNEVLIDEDQAWFHALHADVFRCGGMYGPYRNVLDSLLRRAASGSSSRRRGKANTVRCHVLDVCRVIEARMVEFEGANGRLRNDIYNVVDDDDVGRRAVEDYVLEQSSLFADYCVARGVGMDEVIRVGAHPLDNDSSNSKVDKRVSNRKIKEDLGVRLCFPTVWDGLEALVYHGDRRPFDP